MDICALQPVDRQLLARKVGNDLAKRHGKKKHYAIPEIKAAARRSQFPDTWDCWALALYSSPGDFADYHAKTREVCDYGSMHHMMIEAVSSDASLPQAIHQMSPGSEGSWFSELMDYLGSIEVSLPDLKLPDIDISDVDP